MPQIHVLRVSTLVEHESDIKQLLRRKLKGPHVLRHGEQEYRFKKSYDSHIREPDAFKPPTYPMSRFKGKFVFYWKIDAHTLKSTS